MPGIAPLFSPSSPYPQSNPGRQLIDGDDFNKISGNFFSAENGKTAAAGGGRPNAYPIRTSKVQFTVIATAGDSAVLPPAWPGLEVYVQNDDAADAMQIFANGNDTINATAGATGVSLVAGAAAMFVCIVTGNWRRFVSA